MRYITAIIFTAFIFCITNCKAQYNNSSRVTSTQNGLLNGASVFTIEFWVRTTENNGSNIYWQRPFLFGNETNGDNSGDFGITINYGYIGMFEGISTLNTDQQFLSNSIRVNDNLWHHIAAVNNGQTINLYVDGNITGSLIAGRQLITTNTPLTFGAASLDHSFNGNTQGNINFISDSYFGEARISSGIRYGARFTPSQSFNNDQYTLALFHLDQNNNQSYNQNNNNPNYNNQNPNYNNQILNPNVPVTFDASEPINNNAAQAATLYISDSTVLYGKLLLGKKDWSLSNDTYIRFFEGNSKKVKYYKPEEIKGFQMGDSYYEPKQLGNGPVNVPYKKTMVKRLTPPGSKMAMYEYNTHTVTKTSTGYSEYKNMVAYFVQLPNTTDGKVYQFSDNKFTPKFETKVSAMVQDKPALADKIKNKDKEFFYSFVTQDTHQLEVWWNIINEYNKP
ncbi:MAG: LamG domain-containing protein [Chitinophagaceae bacterium]|nr:LamG domain-containing protein [Chitinophagaceae bacterium]